MDTELFELCKAVYEKTGWKGNGDVWHYHGSTYRVIRQPKGKVNWVICPLYTSDYLLGKLADLQGFRRLKLTHRPSGWYAQVDDRKIEYVKEAATPVKALLKLTLALDDAGELSKVEN